MCGRNEKSSLREVPMGPDLSVVVRNSLLSGYVFGLAQGFGLITAFGLTGAVMGAFVFKAIVDAIVNLLQRPWNGL